MPQVVLLLIAGAGAIAGARWVAKQLDQLAEEARRAAAEAEQRAREARSGAARDLGVLELDPSTGQYRPKGR